MNDAKIAVVTGANRGLGFETGRQLARLGYHVILTARDLKAGAAAAKKLQAEKLDVEFRKLDVQSADEAQALARHLRESHGRVDALVNNAGIMPDTDGVLDVTPVTLMQILNTNTLGAVRLIQALSPLMGKGARVVNVSSGMGALEGMGGGNLGYRMSKAALNAATRVFAAELASRGIQVNSADPGWVRTDMGGAGAPRPVAKGVETIVWLASAAEMKDSGGFWRDKHRVAW